MHGSGRRDKQRRHGPYQILSQELSLPALAFLPIICRFRQRPLSARRSHRYHLLGSYPPVTKQTTALLPWTAEARASCKVPVKNIAVV